jgi:REP element-mobilizing transposase RayT
LPTETTITLYQNKYRIESARHPNWNYSANGWYFITICTHDRQHFFGTIQNGTMQLSSIGQIVAEEWQKTAMIRPYVVLDEWVVMPNHFHAIVGIQNTGRLQPKSLGSIVGQFKSICTKRIWATGYPKFAWQPRFHDHIIRNPIAFDRICHYIQTNPKRWKTDKFNHRSF